MLQKRESCYSGAGGKLLTLKKIMKLIQRSQNKYYVHQVKNKKAAWTLITHSKVRVPKSPINKIKHEDKYYTNPSHIVKIFNNHFVDQDIGSSRGRHSDQAC